MKRLLFFLPLLLTISAVSQTSNSTAKKTPEDARDRAAEAIHRNNLGTAYMNQQEFEHALKLFREAVAFDSKLEVAHVNEGIALANIPQYEPAIQVLQDVVKSDPNNVYGWYNLGLI